jgi:hypothetical protein
MEMEIALQSQLNPLINDYGFAMEQARAQMELENAATEAGLALTPQRRAEIEQLAEGYATATANAARLAEQQDMVRESAERMGQIGRDAVQSIVDGFIEGKNAGDIMLDVIGQIGRELLNMGLNSMFSGGGGLNPLGFLGGMFGGRGFATGTPNTGGARGQVRGVVHGQEAVIPLPNGGRVPVDVRMPSMAAMSASQKLSVHVSLDNDMLRAVVRDQAGRTVAQAAPTIVAASTKQANRSAPGAMGAYQRDVVGGDWR